MYEMQLTQLRDQMEALAAKHARDLETAKAIALSEKKAALAAMKKDYLSKCGAARATARMHIGTEALTLVSHPPPA